MAASIKFIIALEDDSNLSVFKEKISTATAQLVEEIESNGLSLLLKFKNTEDMRDGTSKFFENLSTVVKENKGFKSSVMEATSCIRYLCTTRDARILKESLEVDRDPKKFRTEKIFSLDDNVFCLSIKCQDVGELRSATNSFLDLFNLVNETILQFGPVDPDPKRICIE